MSVVDQSSKLSDKSQVKTNATPVSSLIAIERKGGIFQFSSILIQSELGEKQKSFDWPPLDRVLFHVLVLTLFSFWIEKVFNKSQRFVRAL